MAKDKRRSSSPRRYRAKSHRRRGSKPIHALPDLLYVGAAATLLGPAAQNMYDDYKAGGISQALNGGNTSYDVKNLMIPQAIPAVELAVIGWALGWVGKKTGLSKIGTKKVKVF